MSGPTVPQRVVIYSDGGCQGNPGPGGWGVVLTWGSHRLELSGGAPATTNNRMELQAAIQALKILREPCNVEFYTDSEYLRQGVTSWVATWKRNGWRTQTKQPVKNDDLWRILDSVASRHQIEWKWLKGHAGHKENERCDQMATAEMTKIRRVFTPAQLKDALTALRA